MLIHYFPRAQHSSSRAVKVIAVAGKGGAGKSQISANIAVMLAKKKNNVLLLDADLSLGNLDIMLGLHSTYNLSHVISGERALADILLTGPYGLKMIPAPSGCDEMTQLSSLEYAGIIDAFNHLTEAVDYLIIDTATGISEMVLSFTRSSQEIIVVLCDEPSSLADTYAFINVMNKQYGWRNFHVLANKVDNPREGTTLFHTLDQKVNECHDITLNFLGVIPYDTALHNAAKKQQTMVIHFPDASFTRAIGRIAHRIEKWPLRHYSSGNTSFFLERLLDVG